MSPHMPVTIPAERTRRFRVLSLGAGVQSTAVYLLALRGEIPPIDAAVFADTGEEPKSVYRHLEFLKTLGGQPIHVVRQSETSLGDNLIHGRNSTGQSFVSIPAFTSAKEGEPGPITKRQCTDEYKLTPIERWVRRDLLGMQPKQRVPKDVHVTQLIGISLDEVARAYRVIANNSHAWLGVEFPLLHRGWSRADCLAWMKDQGYPTPPRSACVFCPYKSDLEWQKLKTEDPEGWARAVEIDHGIRQHGACAAKDLTDKLYLHRSCVPIDKIDFAASIASRTPDYEQLGFWHECKGMCGN